jgi:hypothetical protein
MHQTVNLAGYALRRFESFPVQFLSYIESSVRETQYNWFLCPELKTIQDRIKKHRINMVAALEVMLYTQSR